MAIERNPTIRVGDRENIEVEFFQESLRIFIFKELPDEILGDLGKWKIYY